MDASTHICSRFLSTIYEFIVLEATNMWIWRAPTASTLLPFFQKYIGENAHLDVGAGTGYYLAASAARLAKTKNVTLLDLDANALAVAESRVRTAGYKGTIDKVEQSVFVPLPSSLRSQFDSISIFHTLHCLPGTFPPKASHVVAQLAAGLAPGGVLYGTTVLGYSASHSWVGRVLIALCNRWGSFWNEDDRLDDLEQALKGYFEEVEVRQVGVVAMFVARCPIRM